MSVYYNEFDKKKAATLRQLIKEGFISQGDVDDRPVQEVRGAELAPYTRCHFFAGIGLWDYALQLAAWPSDRPVWTGSCPCQPFSNAGKQKGKADERHLWPPWLRLICECSPATLFGEQVSSSVALGWLDDVYQGLETEGYAVGAAVLPACSVGAPHKRDRLWFVGNAKHDGQPTLPQPGSDGAAVFNNTQGQNGTSQPEGAGSACDVADACSARPQGHRRPIQESVPQGRERTQRYPWESGVWIDCPDGKQRLVEPSIPLLAHGYPERVGVLHSAGDAIVPQVAAEFIKSFMEAECGS